MSSVVIASYNKNNKEAIVSWDKHKGYIVSYTSNEELHPYTKSYHAEPNAIKAAVRFINK